ncbi:MAG: hypothetical protein LBK58_10045 [Prevotellaceae bacterium]|jgi:hypothetical protein|nr:hypothetical protein [Prevotellaceae bacterium]
METGISADRLRSAGRGQSSPVADNGTDEGRAKNRRVEFVKINNSSKMEIIERIERIKSILLSPKTEWQTVEAENAPHMKVFTTYVVPLALIPAIAAFVGYGLTGYSVFGVHVHSVS